MLAPGDVCEAARRHGGRRDVLALSFGDTPQDSKVAECRQQTLRGAGADAVGPLRHVVGIAQFVEPAEGVADIDREPPLLSPLPERSLGERRQEVVGAGCLVVAGLPECPCVGEKTLQRRDEVGSRINVPPLDDPVEQIVDPRSRGLAQEVACRQALEIVTRRQIRVPQLDDAPGVLESRATLEQPGRVDLAHLDQAARSKYGALNVPSRPT